MATRRAADPEHFADLSLSVVKLLGPGIYVLERRRRSTADMAHFGLAVADYVHSTAPNRRFADLVTQRMLYAVADEARSAVYGRRARRRLPRAAPSAATRRAKSSAPCARSPARR